MRQSLVPVLLLATAALSSSNVLPTLSLNQLEIKPLGLDGQQIDNIILTNNFHIRNNILFNLLCKEFIAQDINSLPKLCKILQQKHIDLNTDNFNDIVNKKDNYNGELRFRQEQWHNYPRQLDRLHRFSYELQNEDDKRNFDLASPNNGDDSTQDRGVNDVATNEFLVGTNDGTHNIYDAVVAATNPLLILKIRLACLNNDVEDTNLSKYSNSVLSLPNYKIDTEDVENDENFFENNINPEISVIKVKREGRSSDSEDNLSSETTDGRKTVKKRLFSLWSRLQSLSHKGHELQHRRHLHAFYGLPDGGDGKGAVTAETRAALMRPPGSPLRWG